MEVATLLGLAGLGYLAVAGTETKQPKKGGAKGPWPQGPTQANVPVDGKEGFQGNIHLKVSAGASAKGSPTQLDSMFENSYGKTYPTQPNPPTKSGFMPTDYAKRLPGGTPDMVGAARPSVAMNPSRVEENPVYVSGNTIVSPLSGVAMATSDFVHNNMQPFFGGRVKQNVNVDTNTSLLDTYTGAGSTQIGKREVETMFDTTKTPFGNPFGMEDNTEFFQSRMDDPALMRRDGEKPFEPVKVAPAIGEKFGSTGKGGFQQFEVNDFMMKNMRKTDDLRTSDNPKSTYSGVVVPGQSFVTKSMDNAGEVRHYRPDTFYIDESGERFMGAFSEESQRESARAVQVLPYQARIDATAELIGPAASQEAGENYVTGAYRTPMAQQYGGAGFRNADMQNYTTKDVDQNDYGKEGFEVRPNERYYTSDRTMALNPTPAENGANTVRYGDQGRPTRREETSGNIRQTGTPVGYAGGAPAMTVWDPTDVARTTVKETTIKWDYRGIASPADGPERLKVYDPEDIARNTQKHQISAKSEYFGGVKAASEKFTSHQSAYNMRLNPSKEAVSKMRKPFAGNGGIGLMNTNVNQTSKKLDVDIIDDRALMVNSVSGLTPGAADIGLVKYRTPLKLDISQERNMDAMVDAVNNNPLQQSLKRNAEHDEALLQKYLQGVA